MKKLTFLSLLLLACFASRAETEFSALHDRDFMNELLRNLVPLAVTIIITSFLLNFTRMVFDSRIKRRLIDKGASEETTAQLLKPLKKETKLEPIKWFSILAGIGVGLSLIAVTQPIGLHSLAIMAFSIAASFLGYYYFTKKTEQRD